MALISYDYMLHCAWLIFTVTYVSTQPNKTKEVVTITDSNWTSVLVGEWMIQLTEKGCLKCTLYEKVLNEFAEQRHNLDISVGLIDHTENPGLSGRFLVFSVPTVYHVMNGQFRYYGYWLKTTDLIAFIDEKKWKDLDPVAWYRSPSSLQMGIIGNFITAASHIINVFNTMEAFGIPEWLSFNIFTILIIIAGLLPVPLYVIYCKRFFRAQNIPLPPERLANQPRDDPTDDVDIIDDTADQNLSNPPAILPASPSP